MRGIVENYCPEVKLKPGLLFTDARSQYLYTPFIDFLVRTEP